MPPAPVACRTATSGGSFETSTSRRRMPRHASSPLAASWAAVGVSCFSRPTSGLGLGRFLKHDPSIPDDAVDLEYLADNLWFVGSPQTVADRILDLQKQTGGFGRLIIVSYDPTDERESWERSLRLLMDEVLPICRESTLVSSGAVP